MLAIPAFNLLAQDNNSAKGQQSDYEKTIHSRAEKIVYTLNIGDSNKANKVIEIVAGQYRNLNEIYTDRDQKNKAGKNRQRRKRSNQRQDQNHRRGGNRKSIKASR